MKFRGFIFYDLATKIFDGNGMSLALILSSYTILLSTSSMKEVWMISRNLLRLALGISLSLAIGTSAFAQCPYPPCTGPGNMTSTGSPPSGGYSSGTGIGIGVAAAAGVGILIYALHHRGASPTQASLVGCTQAGAGGEGITLVNEKDKEAYTLVAGSTDLKPGERVELTGKKTQDGSGKRTFQVQKLAKDYGPCKTETAINASSN